MKKIETILWALILVCLCALAWISTFIWHNSFCIVLFTASIFVWLFALEAEQND